MSGRDQRTTPAGLAEQAARILRAHRDVMLRGWAARVEALFEEKGLDLALAPSACVADAEEFIGRFLDRLGGARDVDELAGLGRWIHDGRQYDVGLDDVVEMLLCFKAEVRQTLAAVVDDESETLRLAAAVDAVLDGMVKRAAELYRFSHDAELGTIQTRFQQILSAWRVEEALSGVESAEEVFGIACTELRKDLPLVGCIARLCDETGQKEKDLFSSDDLPVPVLQAMRPDENQAGRLDVLDACRQRHGPMVCQADSADRHAEGAPLTFGPQPGVTLLNQEQLVDAGVQSLACLPMPVGNGLAGGLLVLCSTPRAFGADEVQLLKDFADVLGLAFARTGRLEKSRRQVTEAEVISRIGRSLLEMPTLAELLQELADAMRQFRDYDEVALFRADGGQGRCVPLARALRPADHGSGDAMPPVSCEIVERCARTGQPVLAGGQSETDRPQAAPAEGRPRACELAMPIRAGGDLLGVICFAGRRVGAFPTSERAALAGLTAHIAAALQKAEMLEEQRSNRRELERVHRQLSAIIRSAAVGITTTDAQGVYTHWSPSCEKMLGYSEDEVVGKMHLTDVMTQPYDLNEALSRCVREGQISEEVTLKRKDGALRIVEKITVPMENGGGRTAGFTSCWVDLTEKKQAQEALRQERDKLDLVVRAMGAGLALFDGHMRLQWANDALMRWFGFGAGAVGKKCRDVYTCGRRACPSCPLQRSQDAGSEQTGMVERTDERGVWHCYLIVATPVQYGQTHLLTLTLDVTEQRRQSEQMQIISNLNLALEGTLDLDRVLRLVLTCVTAGHALGFNRAFVFLLDSPGRKLVGNLAIGPTSQEEAGRIWKEIADQSLTLEELLAVEEPADGDQALSGLVRSFEIPLEQSENVLVRTLSTHQPAIVRDARSDPDVGADLTRALQLEEFVCVPLVARDEPLGVMLADDRFSRTAMDEHRVELLRMFSAQASMAIANAHAYQRIRDQVAEIHRTHQELIESERLASVGRMASHLAHEIRNPLSTIGGFAKAIQREQGAAERTRRNASIIYDEVIRLENTLANVLDLGRPVRPETKLVDLNALIGQTVREFRGVLQEGGIELRLRLAPELPRADVDPRMIKQVVINLLKNACEALEGRDRKRIDVATQARDQNVSITVSDTGGGMDEKTCKTLFAPFFTTKVGGTGLGLSITQKIVAQHGGDISVDSEPGKGSVFRILLPVGGAGAVQPPPPPGGPRPGP